jgi:serine/threonine protein phosphatase PrpC
MSPNSPDPTQPRPAGSQSIRDRLKGVEPPPAPPSAEEEVLPSWDAVPVEPVPAIPVAVPVDLDSEAAENIPVALPVESETDRSSDIADRPPGTMPPPVSPAELTVVDKAVVTMPELQVAAPVLCRVCGSPRHDDRDSCADCGYYFTAEDLAPAAAATPVPAVPVVLIRDRYERGVVLSQRGKVTRSRGVDHGAEGGPVPVIILSEEAAPDSTQPAARGPEAPSDSDILPGFDEDSGATVVLPAKPVCPSLAWERTLLKTFAQPSLPRLLDDLAEGGMEYLIEELPAGRSLWDAWDDPETTTEQRFDWLIEIAETMHSLHHCGAIFEGLRPDNLVIAASGHARIRELTDVLPLPLLPDTPIRGSLYGAPELVTGRGDARSDLYTFGALLYALHVGRELDEADFDRPGHPKPFVPRFPDVHPAFGRLMSKTFRREIEARFPSDEAVRDDGTGFVELIRTLNVLRRTYDNVRLEIAAWTTTGMVRTGNEDAFALLHACESRQDDLGESALVLLADGMGGYEAGEVAAALAIQVLRQHIVAEKQFAALAGASHFPTDALTTASRPEGHAPPPLDVEACKQALRAALREANRQVYAASRAPGARRRGMGCTAEAVYITGKHVVVGHIGDSRTYHLHEGRLIQLTRDQTLVNRLVELGTLTDEEAENHPRRNELQQAVGGQPDIEPGLYSGRLSPGDWVVVCSDGLSNHVGSGDLKQMLLSEAQSAEMAARRLVNLANIEGAADNATVVVIRAT